MNPTTKDFEGIGEVDHDVKQKTSNLSNDLNKGLEPIILDKNISRIQLNNLNE